LYLAAPLGQGLHQFEQFSKHNWQQLQPQALWSQVTPQSHTQLLNEHGGEVRGAEVRKRLTDMHLGQRVGYII
jgi:hypothetical protein